MSYARSRQASASSRQTTFPKACLFIAGVKSPKSTRATLTSQLSFSSRNEKFERLSASSARRSKATCYLRSVGTLGSVYVVKPGDRFYFKDGNLTWFRHFKGLDSQFLYYWIGSPQGKAELQKCTIGSSQSAFTIVLLKSMEIDSPRSPSSNASRASCRPTTNSSRTASGASRFWSRWPAPSTASGSSTSASPATKTTPASLPPSARFRRGGR